MEQISQGKLVKALSLAQENTRTPYYPEGIRTTYPEGMLKHCNAR